jgi:hypothetical protein
VCASTFLFLTTLISRLLTQGVLWQCSGGGELSQASRGRADRKTAPY